ncbi:helix-turn-helix transcriptional regulator [Enterobacter quasiroggenkampii]|uniref:helix-turn-helix transcriptional regulator n=1 Tax=Enterobacter quasiroggenkampii TaxID=2497436 RepID=UPI0021D12F52|nr:LuxR C-terminal-related transcriptional regulator [Enterobacter quasiroggenkampii]MCU6306345.1 LuxR C-terminal-related transcriptional regulator [Enterobacter quasiroggenkampii]MCU6398425.1 LuxR C-terminal-related transcriptional regulator [Enterobacter quasiroggenkampii]
MFVFTVRAVSCNQTYLYGLTLSFNEMLHNNPHWSYRLLSEGDQKQENPHLIVLDFTAFESLEQVTHEHYTLLTQEKGYQLLVLLHANQTRLTAQLLREHTCSLLSIDEHTFQVRDIIDACLHKRRFISASVHPSWQRQPLKKVNVSFTSAEEKVLEYIMKGHTGIEISRLLFRSQKTISSHKRNIMKKLDVKDEFHFKLMILER